MNYVQIFNIIEIIFWLGMGSLLMYYSMKKAPSRKAHAAAAGITLLVFSITDIIEIFTGSWWDPWWLLALNMLCIFSLIMIYLTFKTSASASVTALTVPSLFAFCYFVLFPDPPLNKIFYYLSRTFLILLPILWRVWAEKKKFPVARLTKKGIGAGCVSGLCIGITALVMYINIFRDYIPTEMVKLRAESLGFTGMRLFIFAGFLIFVNAALEEYYWRWFSFTQLKKSIKPVYAQWISSAGFGLHHVIVLVVFFGWLWGFLFGLCVCLGGAIWVHHYRTYDSIWPSFISHALVDAFIMLIGFDMILCT